MKILLKGFRPKNMALVVMKNYFDYLVVIFLLTETWAQNLPLDGLVDVILPAVGVELHLLEQLCIHKLGRGRI